MLLETFGVGLRVGRVFLEKQVGCAVVDVHLFSP